jgi:type 1 glutamine amidotransferase
LDGDEPITVVATSRCQTTGQDEPQAFVYSYNNARVFQTTLGHSASSIRNPGAAALIRQGSLWAAGKIEESQKHRGDEIKLKKNLRF